MLESEPIDATQSDPQLMGLWLISICVHTRLRRTVDEPDRKCSVVTALHCVAASTFWNAFRTTGRGHWEKKARSRRMKTS